MYNIHVLDVLKLKDGCIFGFFLYKYFKKTIIYKLK